MEQIVFLVPALGVLALIYTAVRSAWVVRQDAGNESMRVIAGHIAERRVELGSLVGREGQESELFTIVTNTSL